MMHHQSKTFNLVFIGISSLAFTLLFLIILTIFTSTSPGELFDLIRSPEVASAIIISLKTSLVVLVFTFVVGFPVAFLLAMKEFKGKALVDALVELPIVMPPMVTGIALLSMLNKSLPGFDIIFTQKGIVFAQFVVASPFFIKTVRESIASIPQNLFDAAASLRASSVFTLFRVVMPLCKTGIIAGLILTWARALGEFGATSMVAGSIPFKTETLTLSIYNKAMSGDLSSAFGVAFLLTLCSLLFLATFKTLFARRRYGY